MHLNKKILVVFLIIICGVFYKSFFWGYVPFPGDLLISEYTPWKYYSYLGYNPGSYPSKVQYFDVLRQIYPWKTLAIHEVLHGNLPLWNPYNFSGAPLLANVQSAVFYPFNVLYLIANQKLVWTFLIILQPFLTLIFTYLYGKKIGISTFGSIVSSISFSFCTFMTVWLQYNTIGHVVLWLPLGLYVIENILQTKKTIWYGILGMSIMSSLLAGHLQVFGYMYVFWAIYFVGRAYILFKEKSITQVFKVIPIFLLGLGVSGIVMLPSIELIQQSARTDHDYTFLMGKILVQPWQLIMILVPDFFGNPATHNYWPQDTYIGKALSVGVVGLVLSFFAFFLRKNIFVRWYFSVGAIVLILISNNPISAQFYKIPLPLISASAPTLMSFLFVFSISILAGFGTDGIQTIKSFKKIIVPLVSIGIFLIATYLFLLLVPSDMKNYETAYRNMLYITGLLVVTAICIVGIYVKRKFVKGFIILLIFIQLFDLGRGFLKFNPFIPSDLVFPHAGILEWLQKNAGVNRFWGYGHARIDANFATQYSLYSPDGYDPLYPKRYGELIHSSREGNLVDKFTKENRSDAVIAPGFGEMDLMQNQYRLRMLDVLGVKYIVNRFENSATENTFPDERFKQVLKQDGWEVYENKKALPRVFIASAYKVFKNADEFEKTFFSSTFDARKTILVEESISSLSEDATGSAIIQSYRPTEVVIKTETIGNGLLFLSDTYYPGWKAFVDDKEVSIYRAHYTFRSVKVPSGIHIVRFVYMPDSLSYGSSLSVVSLIGFIGYLMILKRKDV